MGKIIKFPDRKGQIRQEREEYNDITRRYWEHIQQKQRQYFLWFLLLPALVLTVGVLTILTIYGVI